MEDGEEGRGARHVVIRNAVPYSYILVVNSAIRYGTIAHNENMAVPVRHNMAQGRNTETGNTRNHLQIPK